MLQPANIIWVVSGLNPEGQFVTGHIHGEPTVKDEAQALRFAEERMRIRLVRLSIRFLTDSQKLIP